MLNNKAKEASAKFRIDMSASIYRSILLAIIILPASLILKAGFEGKGNETKSLVEVVFSLPFGAYFTFMALLAVGVYLASNLYASGINMLNEIDEK